MEIRFFPAKETDAAAISRLRREIWDSTYRGIYPDGLIDDYDFSGHVQRDAERIKNPVFTVYLIKDEDRPIGYFNIEMRGAPYIQSLYILKAYQGRGIGKKAFALMREYCKTRGFSSFTCHCNAHNTKARGFYEALGGVIISRDEGHENKREDQVEFQFDV